VQDPALSVTYWMNSLQSIPNTMPIFVTLNPKTPIATDKVFDRHVFHHPVFDHAAIAAQPRVQALQGLRNTWYCGAHLRHGFHEDGLASAVHVARLLGADAPWRVRTPLAPDFAGVPARGRQPAGLQNALGHALTGPETA
jgi:uncharacterized protein